MMAQKAAAWAVMTTILTRLFYRSGKNAGEISALIAHNHSFAASTFALSLLRMNRIDMNDSIYIYTHS